MTLAYVGARFAKAPGNTYDMGMGPVLLGAFMFVWGFSRWLRRWLRCLIAALIPFLIP